MTTDYIAQMGPMWLTAGLMIAWLADAFWRVDGYGLLTDLVLGIVGSIAAGTLVWTVLVSDAGMLVMFAIGGAGAIVVIAAQRRLWRPTYGRV